MTDAPWSTGGVHDFVNALPDPMWIFDRKTLRILFANPAAGRMMGCAPADLLQLGIDDLRLPEDASALHAAVAALGDSAASGGIWRLRHTSGESIHADFHWAPMVHDGHDAVLASIRDVTRLVKLERERAGLLAEAEDQRAKAEAAARDFRQIFQSVPGKFLVLTPDDHRIVAASDAFLEATLTRREEILGRSILEILADDQGDPERDAALRASLARVATEGMSDTTTVRRYPIAIPRPAHLDEGYEERFWSIVNAPIRNAEGLITHVVHRVEDVTEFVNAARLAELSDGPVRDFAVELLQRTDDLRQANAQLRETEANLRTAQRLLDIGIWKMNIDTGTIWWSDDVAGLCGLSPDQAPRDLDAFMALIHPDDRAAAQTEIEHFLTSGGTHLEFQHRILRPDGGSAHLRGVGELTEMREGRMLIGVVQDVSAQIDTSHEIARMDDMLQLAGTIAQLGGWYVAAGAKVVEWSKQTAALHDLEGGANPSVEEAIAFYIPEHRDRLRAMFRACIEDGEPFDDILQIETATGRRPWVRTVGRPVRDGEGAVIAAHGAIQDISDIVVMRDRTQQLARSLMRTLENMSDAVVTLSPDWRYTFVNSPAERMLKRRQETLIGRVIWDVFPEAIGSNFQREFEQAMATGRAAQFEAYYPAPLDTWFEVNAYPSADGLGVYFRDVGEKRQADEVLRRSEERFRMIARATDDIVWDWDLVTGAIWANERMQQVLGHSTTDTPADAETWRTHVHPDDLPWFLDSMSRAIASTADTWQGEYRYCRADGSYATLTERGVFMRDASGQVVRMISSVTDVTGLRESEAQLRQALRLEAVGQLTGGLAHDFNNLLTIVLGNAELLADRLEQPRLRRMAQMTAQAAERGAELTNRLLSFARQQPLDPRAVDLVALLKSIDGLLRRTVSEEIDLCIHANNNAGNGPWFAQVDAGQLELAVLNLVINARDAMPDGGSLRIGVSNVVLSPDDLGAHDDVAPGEYVAIQVVDTGTGMPPEVLERVFEPFFTTKSHGKGSGLGLSMVYGFVKQSGGHVTIDTEPGKGTTVRLCFRRADVDTEDMVEVEAVTVAGDGTEHILVVEDDNHVREHLIEQLRSLGYRVSSAPDGQQALNLLDAMTDLDLLLTDVVMPGGMNGRQLADEARRRHPGLRVLFTSGYSETALMHNGRLDDGVELLSKPYRRQELAAKVRKVLDVSKP